MFLFSSTLEKQSEILFLFMVPIGNLEVKGPEIKTQNTNEDVYILTFFTLFSLKYKNKTGCLPAQRSESSCDGPCSQRCTRKRKGGTRTSIDSLCSVLFNLPLQIRCSRKPLIPAALCRFFPSQQSEACQTHKPPWSDTVCPQWTNAQLPVAGRSEGGIQGLGGGERWWNHVNWILVRNMPNEVNCVKRVCMCNVLCVYTCACVHIGMEASGWHWESSLITLHLMYGSVVSPLDTSSYLGFSG